MFRLPGNHATRATKNALGPDERAATSSTEMGMNHMSHQRGCKPVAKNSASDEQTIATISHPIEIFLAVEPTQSSPILSIGKRS